MEEGLPGRGVIFTVGYEGLQLDEFIEMLATEGIELVVDVRQLPLSRKRGFSKTPLAGALQTSEIEYRHIRALGAPREIRNELKQDGDWDSYRCSYEQLVLNRQEQQLEVVSRMAAKRKTALMCFERDPAACHRTLIAERMRELGLVANIVNLATRDAPELVASDR